MKTISVLADIIIPKDDVSGSATDAKVPDFIEFIVKDMPHHQLPMRGGLKWLDMQCAKRFNQSFVDCTSAQQIEVVDDIAFPEKASPEMQQGLRSSTACAILPLQDSSPARSASKILAMPGTAQTGGTACLRMCLTSMA